MKEFISIITLIGIFGVLIGWISMTMELWIDSKNPQKVVMVCNTLFLIGIFIFIAYGGLYK